MSISFVLSNSKMNICSDTIFKVFFENCINNSFSIWNTFLEFQDVETELLWSVSNRGLTWRQDINKDIWAFLLPDCYKSKEKLEKMVSDLYWLMWKMEFMDAHQYEKNLIDNILYVKRWLDW